MNTDKTTSKASGEAESTQIEEHTCSECGRATITDETGALVCVACGLEWETATASQKSPQYIIDRLNAKPDWANESQAKQAVYKTRLANGLALTEAMELERQRDELHRLWDASAAEARRNKAHAEALAEALRDVELRTTQARIASGIGKRKNQTEFLLGELERIAGAAREALARWEAK